MIELFQTYTLPKTGKAYVATPLSGDQVLLKDMNKSHTWSATGFGQTDITTGTVEGLLVEGESLYEVAWEFVSNPDERDWLEVTDEETGQVFRKRTRPTSEKILSRWKVADLMPCEIETITIKGW